MNIKLVNSIPDKVLNLIINLYKSKQLDTVCETLGEGVNAIVYGYKSYAIKVFKNNLNVEKNDPTILQKIYMHHCFPKIYAYIPNQMMIYERIYGETVYNALLSNIEPKRDWLDNIKDAIIFVLENDLNPCDIQEHNVMISDNGDPYIVDVGGFKNFNTKITEDNIENILNTLYISYYGINKELVNI